MKRSSINFKIRLPKKDKEYFLKKMRWNENKLDDYLSQKEISHSFYDSEKELWNTLENIYKKSVKIFPVENIL